MPAPDLRQNKSTPPNSARAVWLHIERRGRRVGESSRYAFGGANYLRRV